MSDEASSNASKSLLKRRVPFWILVGLFAMLLAFMAWLKTDSGRKPVLEVSFVSVLILIPIVIAMIAIAVVIHELGHAIVGLMMGFRFGAISVGFWLIGKNIEGRWIVVGARTSTTLGSCLMSIVGAHRVRRRSCCYFLGGSTANLLVAAIIYWGAAPSVDALWHSLNRSEPMFVDPHFWPSGNNLAADRKGPDSPGRGAAIETALIVTVIANAIFGLMNLLPNTKEPWSDGRVVMEILFDTRGWRARARQLRAWGWIMLDLPPDRWPRDDIAAGLEPADRSEREAFFRFLSFWRAQALGDLPMKEAEAHRLNELQLELGSGLMSYIRAERLVTAAEMRSQLSDDEIAWISAMRESLGRADRVLPILAESALATSRGDDALARKQLNAAMQIQRPASYFHDELTRRLTAVLDSACPQRFDSSSR